MCYAPVCHLCITTHVRLACLKHAATVHPELGSNSQKNLIEILANALSEKVRVDAN